MNLRRGILIAVALLACAPSPVLAAEDAGTSSVFSQGAGSSALAQGGAVLTLADDPYAWIWNPAGIGLASRMSVQLDQSTPTAFDYRESSGGFVLPSWRFGAVALGYRQFAVDGIEARDPRGAVVGGDLSDRQSELSFGYGRAFGSYGSIGGVFRARRQELAGRSASAFGADLGVILRPSVMLGSEDGWMRDLTLAFVTRNILQPSLRLDLDEVADPRGRRLGIGFQPHFPGGWPARIEVDFDATDGRATRLLSGLEFTPHPIIDLRFGKAGSGWTSGTGLHLKHFDVDYAFDNGPATSTHRVGIGFRFGSSVEQLRANEETKRDEELEARLASTFEARRAARTEELLQSARAAHAAGDLQGALEVIATVRALEPGDARPRALETGYLLEQAATLERGGDLAQAIVLYSRAVELTPDDSTAAAGVRRCRSQSALVATRSAELESCYSSALQLLASGELSRARRELAAVVTELPKDAEARRMLEMVDRSIASRLDQSLAQAARLIRVGALDDAEQLISSASALDPSSPRVAASQASLARARNIARDVTPNRPAVVGQRVRALPPADRAAVEKLWQLGQNAMQAGRQDEAVRYWELILSKDPSHQRAGRALSREYLSRGMDAFAAGRLSEAVSQWENALRIDPRDERARAYLTRAQEHLSRTSGIGSR